MRTSAVFQRKREREGEGGKEGGREEERKKCFTTCGFSVHLYEFVILGTKKEGDISFP